MFKVGRLTRNEANWMGRRQIVYLSLSIGQSQIYLFGLYKKGTALKKSCKNISSDKKDIIAKTSLACQTLQ